MTYGQAGRVRAIDPAWRKVAFAALAAIVVVLAFGETTPRAAGNFTPTIKFETSTTRATAHPDARITIDNSSSSEDLRDLTIDLPKGLLGSLNAAEQCSEVDALAVDCGDESLVGTVINEATVDNSDVKLKGKIYLTEPLNSTDPAGLQIVVPAVIGGVDMGEVVVNARVQIRYGTLPGSFPAGAQGPVDGIRTVVTDVPNEITDSNNRTVEFSLQKLVVDLRSDQTAPYSKLLTNPSVCSTTQITAQATSYNDTDESMSQDYTVDECASAKFANPDLEFTKTSSAANTSFGFSTSIDLPENQGSSRIIDIAFGPSIGTNLVGLGNSTSDQCPATTASATGSANGFDPTDCPEQALVGEVVVETPLTKDPLVGELYLIEKTPVPNIGMYIDEGTGPNNPQGVRIGLVGLTNSDILPAGCDADESLAANCGINQLRSEFRALPDVPITSISVTVDGADRDGEFGTLSGHILRNASAAAAACVPNDDVVATFTSHLGNTRKAAAITGVTIAGCNARAVTMTGAPYGGTTSSTTPALPFASAESTNYCSIDARVAANPTDPDWDPETEDDQTCSDPFTPATSLTAGVHRLFVFGGTEALDDREETWRAFVVEPTVVTDTTPPTVSIDSGPSGTTSQTTPTWTFSADESSQFQCSVDDSAFLPCDPLAANASSGEFEVSSEDAFFAGTSHKFEVRAQDSAGNVGAPAVANIDVAVDFGPSLDVDLSTTQARANPDLDVTIQSNSGEDLKSVKLAMPDGFFGGLTGVASLCPIATAAAGNCTSASQVGTVETEARVDDSLIRIDGQVYLTESAHFGEPAGLSIKVPAVIQDVNLGNIIVSGRLQVRGQAEGIDSLVIDIPDRIIPNNPPYNDGETEFDMRKIALKLRTGAGASHPLLVNPSSCNGSAFIANFGGYDSSATTESSPYAATGCEALGFSPSLSLSVIDADTGQPPGVRSDGKSVSANLNATLTANPGEASIRDVSILMPRPLTINVLEIPIACTVAQYADGAGQCPESSKVGSVSAISPLLPEPLTGNVYLLKQSDPARAVPRMLLALRGRINIDIIADNRFENLTQIRTIFTNLPDVPLSSFTMKVDRVLSTRNEACTVPADEWGAVGQMVAANGKSIPVSQPLTFGCKPKYSFRYRKKAKKTTLNVTAVGGPVKLRRVNVSLPKRVVTIKRGLKRKLIVRADGKKLAARCYKVGKTSIKVTLCGRSVGNVAIQFKSGSLNASRKAPVPKRVKSLRISGVDTAGKRVVFSR